MKGLIRTEKELLRYVKRLSRELRRLNRELFNIAGKNAIADNCTITIKNLEDQVRNVRYIPANKYNNLPPKILVLYEKKTENGKSEIQNLDDLFYYLDNEGLTYKNQRDLILEELNFFRDFSNYGDALLHGFAPKYRFSN